LLQRASGEEDDEEVLQRIMRLMEASHLRLAGEFDPGEQTQRIQRRILDDLDEALKRSRNQSKRKTQSQQQQQSGDRRQRGRRQQKQSASRPSQGQSQSDKPESGQDSAQSKSDESGQGRQEDERQGKAGRVPRDRGRQWGNLPARDRDAVLQGIKDDYLPKFKELIERYYKALAKPTDDPR
jgi:hypothetical protein